MLPWIQSSIAAAIVWIVCNKDKISAIILRIEKDSQDSWTNEEKEQLALDLFFQEVYSSLPWFLKLIPKVLVERELRKLIKAICKKAKEFKGKVRNVFNKK